MDSLEKKSQSKEISRRQFLKGMAGAAGLGLCAVAPGFTPSEEVLTFPTGEGDAAAKRGAGPWGVVAPASEGGSALTLTVLGARGSSPICRSDSMTFGGATSCYMLRAGGETLFLDAGSGLQAAPDDLENPPVFLLSHLHMDHLLGLGMYARLSQKNAETILRLPAEDGDAARSLDGLYSPPYWPLRLEEYGGTVSVLPHSFPLQIGEITVDGMKGCHPGGVWCFRIRYGDKSLVYASDFEHEEPYFSDLVDFARDADLVLYDGQYTSEEYESKKGFGHSTPEKGLELLEHSGASRLLLIHHDPSRTDEQLLDFEAKLGRENVRFAREGDIIVV